MNIETLLDDRSNDVDLDALMARIREAAGAAESAAQPPPGEPGERNTTAAIDLGQVLAAQAAWNERTTKSLAAIVDCLQSLQDAWQALDARARADSARAPARARPRRPPAGRPRQARSTRRKGRST